MTEDELQDLIVKRAEFLELLVFHSTDPRRDIGPGFPDLVLTGPRGVIFAELKSVRGVMSEDQRAWHKTLWNATRNCPKVLVTVWSPVDWDSGLIERRLLELC